MRNRRLLFLLILVAARGFSQWLNFPTPGVPRTRDGKPNLSAPTPRAADGKPDLSGVWLHEHTSLAEMRRIFGATADDRDKVNVPGMDAEPSRKPQSSRNAADQIGLASLDGEKGLLGPQWRGRIRARDHP